MTSTIFVRQLNRKGIFLSKLDNDPAFVSKENPQGFFRIVVQPRETYKGGRVLFKKINGGYIIEGEGRILSGSREDIADRAAEYRKRRFDDFALVEDESLSLQG